MVEVTTNHQSVPRVHPFGELRVKVLDECDPGAALVTSVIEVFEML